MKLTIQLFAGLKDLFQQEQIEIEIEGNTITAEELKQHLMSTYPEAKNQLQQTFIAKNHAYAQPNEPIGENDEIALIPPVSGGENPWQYQEMIQLTYDPIDIQEVTQKVIHPNHGASILFLGTTREYTHGKKTVYLEYEAYEPMALKAMQQIAEEIARKWEGTLVAITHRLGKVDISETSVAIAVSAPHRQQCYEASRYAIDRLKQIVPIWKKEIWDDGYEWKGHQLGPWNPTEPLNEQ